jgi:hypothetical protein
MPEISRFFGIVITMWFNDHGEPHFHAHYGEHKAKIAIETGALSGNLPPHARALVVEWAALHREELLDNWALLRARRPTHPVAPLE